MSSSNETVSRRSRSRLKHVVACPDHHNAAVLPGFNLVVCWFHYDTILMHSGLMSGAECTPVIVCA